MIASELRVWLALLLALAWLSWTATIVRRQRRIGGRVLGRVEGAATEQILIGYASQTGFAEQWAQHSAQALRAGGQLTTVRPLAQLTLPDLQSATPRRALFVVSTYGEGDPPDNAAVFARRIMQQRVALPRLQYAVLALGDRSYQRFCGFGRALHAWLQASGAQPLAGDGLIEVDNADPVALGAWQAQLRALGAPDATAELGLREFSDWRLLDRHCLNPGSPGAPAFLLKLVPKDAQRVDWQAGDLVEVCIPAPPAALHRHYSIASCPHEGQLWLLVRQHRDTQGKLGVGSGLLTAHTAVGDTLQLRVQRNSAFHLPDDGRPLILIGNGTGIAGLRALLSERVRRGQRENWLLFGERSAAHDLFFGDELHSWLQAGLLRRTDLAFSRDGNPVVYVQDLLDDPAIGASVRQWLANGAAIYVCGSQQGMAPAVHTQLQHIWGEAELQLLLEDGRYRRDVY